MRASLRGVAVAPASVGPFAQRFEVPSGEDASIALAVFDAVGAPFDLTGGTLTLSATTSDGSPALSTFAAIDAGVGGTATFALAAADTLALAGRLTYQVAFARGVEAWAPFVPASVLFVPNALGRPGQATTSPAAP